MTETKFPNGWLKEPEEYHESSTVADVFRQYRHPSQARIILWENVEENGRDYHVDEHEDYAVEFFYPMDEFDMVGYAFSTIEEAMEAVIQFMRWFP